MKDVNESSNVVGAGINIAQRVMDCGDARHVLVSKRVADEPRAGKSFGSRTVISLRGDRGPLAALPFFRGAGQRTQEG
jgi:class 3 adenylate cyclase